MKAIRICDCQYGTDGNVTEACPMHFEYGSRMVEAALAGVAATQGKNYTAGMSFASEPAPAARDETLPLDVYPIELHPRTLHALIMAQLLCRPNAAMSQDADNRATQLHNIANIATQLTTISREHNNR